MRVVKKLLFVGVAVGLVLVAAEFWLRKMDKRVTDLLPKNN